MNLERLEKETSGGNEEAFLCLLREIARGRGDIENSRGALESYLSGLGQDVVSAALKRIHECELMGSFWTKPRRFLHKSEKIGCYKCSCGCGPVRYLSLSKIGGETFCQVCCPEGIRKGMWFVSRFKILPLPDKKSSYSRRWLEVQEILPDGRYLIKNMETKRLSRMRRTHLTMKHLLHRDHGGWGFAVPERGEPSKGLEHCSLEAI